MSKNFLSLVVFLFRKMYKRGESKVFKGVIDLHSHHQWGIVIAAVLTTPT